MKWIGIISALAALASANPDARALSPRPGAEPGARYMITRSYETAQQASDGVGPSTSSGHDTLVERVVAVREDGVELEYDLPEDVTQQDRARDWHFPARVLRRPDGPTLLLNRDELESRLERWLAAAEWTREVCGRWIFTWNAFRIDCEPESVVGTIEEYDLRSADLRDGAPYRQPGARGPGTLARIADGPEGARFAAIMEIDPDAVRRARAESDVVAGEIMRQPVTLEAALRDRASERVSGTIEVTFDADRAGQAWRRTVVTRLEIDGRDGRETDIRTVTVERRPVPGATAPR